MSIINNGLLLASGADAATTYQISRSLRFNSADSAYLSRTPASAGNRKTWTWSAWVKRSGLGYYTRLFNQNSSGNCAIQFQQDDTLRLFDEFLPFNVVSTQVFRDPSAWYHIVVSLDTTQATASNRVSLYVNGTKITSLSTANYPAQNAEAAINLAVAHGIGNGPPGEHFGGYLADIYFLDGTATDPSTFAQTDAVTGQWVPKTPTGISYGTNGFKLTFADNSAATATTLGKDTSGNGNNWTPNNFQATVQTGRLYAQASGTSTSAFSSATLLGNFPATVGGSYAIYDADLLTATTSATFSYLYSFSSVVEVLVSADGTNWTSKGNQSSSYTTVSHTSAFRYVRWFYSTFNFGITNNPAQNDPLVDTPTSYGTDDSLGGSVRGNYATFNPTESSTSGTKTLTNGNLDVLLADANAARLTIPPIQGSGKYQWEITIGSKTATYYQMGLNLLSMVYATGDLHATFRSDGNLSNTLSGSWSGTGISYTSGDVITVTYDNATNACAFYKNGVYSATFTVSGTPQASLNFGVFYGGSGNTNYTLNAGQRPFAYPVSGFKALCDTNLPAPVVAKPSTVMDVKLYTGNGSSQTISGLGFSPDLVWIKDRTQALNHALHDVVRGAGAQLIPNDTTGEITTNQVLTAFTSSGFTVNWVSGFGRSTNESSDAYVAWTWDAGTSTVTNTQGSISSQVRANASAGFSIVSWNSTTNVAHTFGHGLGVAPQFVIVKRRGSTGVWRIGHKSIGWTQALQFDTGAALAADGAYWNNTAPTSTVVSIGDTGQLGGDNIAYCWTPVAGYSSFGSYIANASADGPFVYLGFRPRWIMIKAATNAGDMSYASWLILDTSRSSYNICTESLYANASYQEGLRGNGTSSGTYLDILSNGFKIKYNGSEVNGVNGQTYVYACFAENPFQYARAR